MKQNNSITPIIKEFEKVMRDFLYEFSKGVGIIWLVKKIRFLKLKDWVIEREK